MEEPRFEIKLSLTEKEIELLRNSTSDLGTIDRECVSLQLKIANAILDATEPPYSSPYLFNQPPERPRSAY